MSSADPALRGPFRLLPGEDAAAFAALRATLLAREAPADPLEEHWVEETVFALWRLRRLRAVESAALAQAERGDTDEPEPGRPLPSLGTLARYRARIERDLRFAAEQLAEARRQRSAQEPAHAGGTDEPEPPPAAGPTHPLNRQQRRRLEALQRRWAAQPPPQPAATCVRVGSASR